MKKGDIVQGRITGIKPYGAFVKINDELDGLIHISELSDGFVRRIDDFIHIGDIVELEVLGINEDQKVSLSFKRVQKAQKKKYVEVELLSGFKPLEEMLPIWIEQYQKGERD
ncbi:MAG: S1 RNA-binding domain-containing protein [Candidatus Izemoplasmatales bacterium]|nr:S1 RNA-binding domain-containing protein [bacterium]MDZ4196008.1 S1 RNA-binding domain-containing protein [Candidatus Izemoplasmatales bacterium]